MIKETTDNILCTQCASIYTDNKGTLLTCPHCQAVLQRSDYDAIMAYASESALYGHLYRMMYEEARLAGILNRRACMRLYEAWAFVGLAALSGILGNASFEIVKLSIRRISEIYRNHSSRSHTMLRDMVNNDAAIRVFLKNISDFSNGMPDVDGWVRHVVIEEMIVDQAVGFMSRSDEARLQGEPLQDGTYGPMTQETVRAALMETVQKGSISEKPENQRFDGFWQVVAQAIPPTAPTVGDSHLVEEGCSKPSASENKKSSHAKSKKNVDVSVKAKKAKSTTAKKKSDGSKK